MPLEPRGAIACATSRPTFPRTLFERVFDTLLAINDVHRHLCMLELIPVLPKSKIAPPILLQGIRAHSNAEACSPIGSSA